jgi:radical SAM superfamily enzyme YgiQ (UPF0313 family)
MKKLRISIIDLVHNSVSSSFYRRAMFSNYSSIMPQVIGVWCKEEGHEVNYNIFTGSQPVNSLLNGKTDVVFISSFTFTAQLAYALSNYFRSKGIVTVLGGPHARCYSEDSCLYFDYVLGLTNKELIKDLLSNFEMNRKTGIFLSASSQPLSIPGVRERWEFIEKVHQHFSIVKLIPMTGSFGCPYTCDFCIDSEISYQPLDLRMIKEDLKFITQKIKHPRVSWYDANFGINFNPVVNAIESVVPPGKIDFIAECSLSVLNERNVSRLKKNGFIMLMPGIDSWYDYGNKSRTDTHFGMDKVWEVADQVNMIQRYIPQVQTNFIIGLDNDNRKDSFALMKRFIDLSPAVYPSFAFLSIFGTAAQGNLKYETENRIIPFPFHLMSSVHTMNIVPRDYSWEDLYVHFIDLLEYSFSNKAMQIRFNANPLAAPKWMTLLLSLTIGGKGKIRFLSAMLKQLQNDRVFQAFVSRESDTVPAFMVDRVKKDLGPLWQWLPNKSLSYNVNTLSNPDHKGADFNKRNRETALM